jgi:hypothetical protein
LRAKEDVASSLYKQVYLTRESFTRGKEGQFDLNLASFVGIFCQGMTWEQQSITEARGK